MIQKGGADSGTTRDRTSKPEIHRRKGSGFPSAFQTRTSEDGAAASRSQRSAPPCSSLRMWPDSCRLSYGRTKLAPRMQCEVTCALRPPRTKPIQFWGNPAELSIRNPESVPETRDEWASDGSHRGSRRPADVEPADAVSISTAPATTAYRITIFLDSSEPAVRSRHR